MTEAIPKFPSMCCSQANLCPSSFSTPCADVPSNYTLQSDFWSRMKVGGRFEWQPLPTSSVGHVPAGHSASQGHLKREDGWENPGCKMSCGRSLEPLSLPAGMSTLTLTARTQLSSFPMPTWVLKDVQLKQSMSQEAALIKLNKELFSMMTFPRIVTHC